MAHNSLTSFINYAKLSGLDISSTVFRGTLHEYAVLDTLSRYKFSLYRTGGSDDKGIDLRGTWNLDRSIPVIVQCKNEAKKIGPKYVRELLGVKTSDLSILASTSTYTPQAIQTMMTSSNPLCLSVFGQFEDGHLLRQMIWNTAASRLIGPVQVKVVHKQNKTILKLV